MKTLRQIGIKIRARLNCMKVDHDWDSVHGYFDAPNRGATCKRPNCGKRIR